MKEVLLQGGWFKCEQVKWNGEDWEGCVDIQGGERGRERERVRVRVRVREGGRVREEGGRERRQRGKRERERERKSR